MNHVQKKHVAIIKRRLGYVQARIATGQHSEAQADWLAAEEAALTWMLGVIEEVDRRSWLSMLDQGRTFD